MLRSLQSFIKGREENTEGERLKTHALTWGSCWYSCPGSLQRGLFWSPRWCGWLCCPSMVSYQTLPHSSAAVQRKRGERSLITVHPARPATNSFQRCACMWLYIKTALIPPPFLPSGWFTHTILKERNPFSATSPPELSWWPTDQNAPAAAREPKGHSNRSQLPPLSRDYKTEIPMSQILLVALHNKQNSIKWVYLVSDVFCQL